MLYPLSGSVLSLRPLFELEREGKGAVESKKSVKRRTRIARLLRNKAAWQSVYMDSVRVRWVGHADLLLPTVSIVP